MPTQPNEKQIEAAFKWAKEHMEVEGTVEIDVPEKDSPVAHIISACDDWKSEGGFYVKAWVWVPIETIDQARSERGKI